MLLVIAGAWSISTFGEASLLLGERRLAEAICFSCLIDFTVSAGARSDVILIAALVSSIIVVYRHRILLITIEVLGCHAMTLTRGQRSLLHLNGVVVTWSWTYTHQSFD